MTNDGDIDRAAILARRRRLILMALVGGLGDVGCREPQPPSRPPESTEPESHGLRVPTTGAEPVRTSRIAEPETTDMEQLRAFLEDPDRDLCVDDPLASYRLTELAEAHKEAIAEALLERGRRAQAENDLACALVLFERAYYLVPTQHWFAGLIGEVAAAAGDHCMAREYLRHFVKYADPHQHADSLQRAEQLLGTPELIACEPVYVPYDPAPCLCIYEPAYPSEVEPPASAEPYENRRQRERAERRAEREQQRASKMFKPRKRR